MARLAFDERPRVAIGLALGEDLEVEAARLGLCGPEIDAIRSGRSFDLLTSRAIALALADSDRREAERVRASEAGISEKACRAIEAWADARRESRYPR